MSKGMERKYRWYRDLGKGQPGITGLETAIILIAFIVVAAVFAFAVLQTGFFATERAKETGQAGLAQVKSTLTPKGFITLTGDGTKVTKITFSVANSAGADPVNLAAAATLVKYTDTKNNYTAKGDLVLGLGANGVTWVATWQLGSSSLVDPGEVVDVAVDLSQLPPASTLLSNTTFTVQLLPTGAPELTISRTTPLEIKNGIMTLQ